eukprot:scaffold61447_cov59-Phaeocystis_antarctica.AAC.1
MACPPTLKCSMKAERRAARRWRRLTGTGNLELPTGTRKSVRLYVFCYQTRHDTARSKPAA